MKYKSDIDESKKRVEAWWSRDIIDRVVVQVKVLKQVNGTSKSATDERRFDEKDLERYFLDPDTVIPRLKHILDRTWFGGDSFPVMFPVSINMVAILANYLGCPMKIVNTDTTWHEPIIHDWENIPSLSIDPSNRIWKASKKLLERAVSETDGYFVGCPDLNGPSEILSLLRGHEKFAMDFYDNPQYIYPAIEQITKSWFECWQHCTAITHRAGGWFFWMGFWSEKPAIDLESDVSCMLSKKAFIDYIIPSIEEQTRLVERTIYHLDGPGAIRHIDALLDLPKLTGIQWVQGAGGGSVLQYIPLLKKIEAAKKLVFCSCRKSELQKLLEELNPSGLHIIVKDCVSPAEGKQIIRKVEDWTSTKA